MSNAVTRTARKIENAAANLIALNGGSVTLNDGPADQRYSIVLPKAAKWTSRGTYSLDGWTIQFLPSGSVVARAAGEYAQPRPRQ